MKNIILILLLLTAAVSAEAKNDKPDTGKKEKLWVSVISNTVNEVYVEADATYSDQKVDSDVFYARPGYLELKNGEVGMKKGQDLVVAGLPTKYRKTNPATGKWEEMTQAEKDVVDSGEKDYFATDMATEPDMKALRELINEKAGIDITEQELIDRIRTKL
jgi:hypothetical protein